MFLQKRESLTRMDTTNRSGKIAMRETLMAMSSVALLSAGLSSCRNTPPIQLQTKTINPSIASIALVRGVIDSDPACTAGSQSGPPGPQAWWNSLRPGQSPKQAGEGVVGFQLWANPTGNCQGFRQDLYRTLFAYDLQSIASLKGLVTKATLTVNAKILPQTRPNSLCEPFTAGGGGVVRLPASTTLPASGFSELPPNQPFPSGPVLFSFPQPWVPGQIAPGVTSSDGGGQRASFGVDVTALVDQALNAGSNRIVFAISGSDEAPRSVRPPSGDFDCRTTYGVTSLTISHL
jgi:hypothetical protein